MRKILLLFGFCLLIVPSLVSAQTRAEHINRCDAYLPDLTRANECFFRAAVKLDDITVCDKMRWTARAAACRRRISFKAWYSAPKMFGEMQASFFLMLLVFLVIKFPPRLPYLQGALVGAAVATIILYIQESPEPWANSARAWLPYASSPVTGLMTFSPQILARAPFIPLFIGMSMMFYSVFIGLLLQYEIRKYAIWPLLYALLLTYWYHPNLGFVHQFLNTVTS